VQERPGNFTKPESPDFVLQSQDSTL